MKEANLWQSSYGHRLVSVVGDLSLPLFGLGEDGFNQLAEEIDVIYHAGAMVNAVLGYAEQYRVNVGGTATVLRLATTTKAKMVHHISTLSVFKSASGGTYCTESTNLGLIPAPPATDAYSRTKYEADRLVVNAREEGVAVNIYRPGTVSGDSTTGRCNPTDYLTRLLVGIVEIGVPEGSATVPFEFTPVDYVARGIAILSRKKEGLNKTYHLTSKPKQFANVISIYSELGYALETHAWDAWHADLLELPENPLYPLLHYFDAVRNLIRASILSMLMIGPGFLALAKNVRQLASRLRAAKGRRERI